MKSQRHEDDDFMSTLEKFAERVLAKAVAQGPIDPIKASRLIVQTVREHWAGSESTYIPRRSLSEREKRRYLIACDFNGRNGGEVMARYQISERHLRRCVAEKKIADAAECAEQTLARQGNAGLRAGGR